VLLYFHRYYITAAIVLSLLVFIYKGKSFRMPPKRPRSTPSLAGMTLPYPQAAVGWEVTFLVALLIFEQSRLFLGELCTPSTLQPHRGHPRSFQRESDRTCGASAVVLGPRRVHDPLARVLLAAPDVRAPNRPNCPRHRFGACCARIPPRSVYRARIHGLSGSVLTNCSHPVLGGFSVHSVATADAASDCLRRT
jgi:hypothetical protein